MSKPSYLVLFFFYLLAYPSFAQDQVVQSASTTRPNPDLIVAAFAASHDGWSVDEVLIDDQRRIAFLKSCFDAGIRATEKSILEQLVRIRKAGKLTVESKKTNRVSFDDELPAAEIAARWMQDHHQSNVDQFMIDPALRTEFDRIAKEAAIGEPDNYRLRKAAFYLRKARELKPELVQRVSDWKVTIQNMSVGDAKNNVSKLPINSGVYIFRDSTGFLYIGQSNNLRQRLTKHLSDSDRKSLARYLEDHSKDNLQLELHVFAKDSPASNTTVREAYESELIRSRKPKLNLAP